TAPCTNRGRIERRAKIADLRLLQRFERLRDELVALFELALGRVEVSRLRATLDLAEQVPQRMGADLATGPFQRVRGAHRACGVAVCEVAGERSREIGQALLELADEDGVQVVAPGGMPDALDLRDEIRIEQQSRHFRSTVNLPRRQQRC